MYCLLPVSMLSFYPISLKQLPYSSSHSLSSLHSVALKKTLPIEFTVSPFSFTVLAVYCSCLPTIPFSALSVSVLHSFVFHSSFCRSVFHFCIPFTVPSSVHVRYNEFALHVGERGMPYTEYLKRRALELTHLCEPV